MSSCVYYDKIRVNAVLNRIAVTHAIGTSHIAPRIVMRDVEIFVICVSINRFR